MEEEFQQFGNKKYLKKNLNIIVQSRHVDKGKNEKSTKSFLADTLRHHFDLEKKWLFEDFSKNLKTLSFDEQDRTWTFQWRVSPEFFKQAISYDYIALKSATFFFVENLDTFVFPNIKDLKYKYINEKKPQKLQYKEKQPANKVEEKQEKEVVVVENGQESQEKEQEDSSKAVVQEVEEQEQQDIEEPVKQQQQQQQPQQSEQSVDKALKNGESEQFSDKNKSSHDIVNGSTENTIGSTQDNSNNQETSSSGKQENNITLEDQLKQKDNLIEQLRKEIVDLKSQQSNSNQVISSLKDLVSQFQTVFTNFEKNNN